MKPHILIATAAILAGCASSKTIDQRSEDALRNAVNRAIDIQRDFNLTWDEAAERAILTLPGGGREFALSDGVITYETDEVCIGAWIVNLTDVVTAPCVDIDWGTDRLWLGGRSDCLIET